MMSSSTSTVATHRRISSEGISSGWPHPHPQHQQAPPISSSDGVGQQDQLPPLQEPDTYFTEAAHSFGNTLTQVTEQIETLNTFLEKLSREYLGDDGGESLFQDREDEQPAPTPPQLHNISEEDLDQELLGISSLFYEPDFDLTPSVTFAQLFMEDDADDDDARTTTTIMKEAHKSAAIINNNNNISTKRKPQPQPHSSLYQPTHELIPLKQPDYYAGHLDRVELALQEQARQKPGAWNVPLAALYRFVLG
jgi:hypothetical protein